MFPSHNTFTGELYHKGLDITYGIRCLLVCFTDGFSPKILDDSRQDEDQSEYEKNLYFYWIRSVVFVTLVYDINKK